MKVKVQLLVTTNLFIPDTDDPAAYVRENVSTDDIIHHLAEESDTAGIDDMRLVRRTQIRYIGRVADTPE